MHTSGQQNRQLSNNHVANDPPTDLQRYTLFTPENDVTGGVGQPTNQRRVFSQPILGSRVATT